MIHIGTSGYSYADWKGPFYPPGLPQQDMLEFYAKRFGTVELNFSFYRVPTARTLEGMCARTPEGFRFTLKLHREMTHDRTLASLDAFRDALAPMEEAGKLGPLLAQFPYSFRNTEGNRAWLARLRQAFDRHPLVVEFRNDGWMKDAVFRYLEDHRLDFCCVDEPNIRGLVGPSARATAGCGYVRFHSRDAAKWYGGDGKERYNYLYRPEELAEWVPRVRRLAEESDPVYVFFNNCHAAQAALNAAQFTEMLEDEGLLE
jgi:uncharacterized protein YecE (DUF72 family)